MNTRTLTAKTPSIVFDLDDTICFPNHHASDSHTKYALAKPNEAVISNMRKLADAGYHIIISSSRRMLTHNGDIDKILEDIGEITWQWLLDHNVPHHELIFGKPYSSTYYVDDKAMTPEMFLQWAENLV
jgi:capsule biosynthesis phosphatase